MLIIIIINIVIIENVYFEFNFFHKNELKNSKVLVIFILLFYMLNLKIYNCRQRKDVNFQKLKNDPI